MNHQITLEELGMIPKQELPEAVKHIDYAIPCAGCICNHCANNVECWDNCTGEMELSCYTCDECVYYDGKGKNRRKTECTYYKITEAHAKKLREKLKVVRR